MLPAPPSGKLGVSFDRGDKMLKRECVMDAVMLQAQGHSLRSIAKKIGKDRRTVKKYLADPSAVIRGRKKVVRPSLLDRFKGMIDAWLNEDEDYTASWVYDHLVPMGFKGSYQIVKRWLRGEKEKKRRIAYLRFETEPGAQAQVDFGEFVVERPGQEPLRLYCFVMILGFSRKLYARFVEKCDLVTFLDCHVRAFLWFGGVVLEVLYDRMKNVFLGKLAGKIRFNQSLTSLAIHYGFKPAVAPAYAAWVKGKVERPIKYIRESFWRGYSFTGIERANVDLEAWLLAKEQRVHGTTHERITARFDRERPCLRSLPLHEFDTSYRVERCVWKDCFVNFDGNRYRVPHTMECLKHHTQPKVALRFKDAVLRVFDGTELMVTYAVPDGKGHVVEDPALREALRTDVENNRRKYGRARAKCKGRAIKKTISPSIPAYALEVERRPMSVYEGLCEEVAS